MLQSEFLIDRLCLPTVMQPWQLSMQVLLISISLVTASAAEAC